MPPFESTIALILAVDFGCPLFESTIVSIVTSNLVYLFSYVKDSEETEAGSGSK